MKSGLFWRWNLFCEPVFQLEAGDTGEMPGIASYKAKVVEFRPHAGDLGKPCLLFMLFNDF